MVNGSTIESENQIDLDEEINFEQTQEQDCTNDNEKSGKNKYYALCSNPIKRLSRDLVGVDAVWDYRLKLWFFERKEDAEIIVERLSNHKSKLFIRTLFSEIVDGLLNGTPQQKKAIKLRCRYEIDLEAFREKSLRFDIECHEFKIDKSFIMGDPPLDLSEQDKKSFEWLRNKWNSLEDEKKQLSELLKQCEGLERKIEKNLEYPWSGIEIPYGYVLNNTGVWKESASEKKEQDKENNKDIQETKKFKICDPVWLAGRSRDYSGSNSGLIVRWIDMDNKLRETCIERRKLHTHGNPIAEELAHNNLAIVPGQEKELSKYLSAFTTNKTYRAVKSLGWLENPVGDLLYVSKNKTFKNVNCDDQEEVIFQPNTVTGGPSALECKGTLEEWQENVAIPCKGNDIPIFLQSHALSGTIIKYADTGSDGVHISGTTSRGKTTVAQTAASVSGCAADPSYAPKLSIIKRWLATANALESLASQSTDSVLVLDEIGQCPGSDLDKVIYNLFGGRGKERMNQQSQHKETRDWCTAVISTGEKTLQERLTETKSKTPPGLFVRFIDLHVEEVFTNYHGEDHKIFVDNLKINCGLFYGTPAATFIQKIVDTYRNVQDLREKISSGCAAIAKEISNNINLSQEHLRVLKLFSFTALTGIWASEWGIFPYSREEILSSASNLFQKWHKDNQKQTEDIRCICAIQDYYVKKRDSAFRPRYLEDKDVRRFSDVFGYTTNEGKFFLTTEGLEQALGELSKKTALKVLHSKGYLLREESPSRNESKKSIDGIKGALRVYVISDKICEFDRDSA